MATIQVSDSTAAALTAQAAASGLEVDTYLSQIANAGGALGENYIREGLEVARRQIASGQISTATVDEIIAKAQQRQVSK